MRTPPGAGATLASEWRLPAEGEQHVSPAPVVPAGASLRGDDGSEFHGVSPPPTLAESDPLHPARRFRPVHAFSERHFVTWLRISPGLFASVWMLKYHFPARRSAACASVSVAGPLIGLATLPLTGTPTPPVLSRSAGPRKYAAEAVPATRAHPSVYPRAGTAGLVADRKV